MEDKPRYFKREGGGLVMRKGWRMAYLDKEGNWVEDRGLIGMFAGGDCNYDEVTADVAREIIESRGGKFEE